MSSDARIPMPESDLRAMTESFMMIIVSEIGDKTFLIAAILAMRHPRITVFLGAFSSLVVMSLLSAELGHILPSLLPKRLTQVAAAGLFFVFGGKMALEGWRMEAGNERIKEEMGEVETELREIEEGEERLAGAEAGNITSPGAESGAVGGGMDVRGVGVREGAKNLAKLVLGPVFVQAFLLTFLGEWGDRSQIATVALGAAHNVYVVTLGTVIGHSACTALAVIGGRYVSTKISVKHITLGGSALFLLFGLMYTYEALYSESFDLIVPPSLPAIPGDVPGTGDGAGALPGVMGRR